MRSIAVESVQFENGGCRLGEQPQFDPCDGKNGCVPLVRQVLSITSEDIH
jgi:hypothetical protein